MEDLKQILIEKVAAEENKQFASDTEISADSVVNSAVLADSQIEGVSQTSVPTMAVNLQEAKDRITELQNFIKYMMVPNIDYGFIPGCPKPMLFKAGAEKLCDIYGLTKQIAILERTENWEAGVFHYVVKAVLTNKRTGLVESEGIGACNNKEKKFASQDPFSIVNSVLKMAKKRAIVDATLAATRTSGIFGQDMENS